MSPSASPNQLGQDRTPRLFLVGMMGAGKTTVGELLAHALRCPLFDSDRQVEDRTGRTVPQIFAESGEPAFRRAEAEALASAAQHAAPVVISVAGGAVLDPGNRQLIKSAGLVVWLRARPETLAARVGEGAGRPLLDGDTLSAMLRLYEQRRPLYAEMADVVIDVDELSPQDVANYALRRTRELAGS